ncbi:MAG: hypothetical protein G8237_11380 [Magnetococcales bacterium]|nr:hypothetical protein [Magnetococcales bacterium]
MDACPNLTFRMTALCSALVMALVSAPAGHAASGQIATHTPARQTGSGSQHIYYPDTARSFYDYQETGAFAFRPMVIPPTVPILTQPAYLIVNAPAEETIQAPMPMIMPPERTKEEEPPSTPMARE